MVDLDRRTEVVWRGGDFVLKERDVLARPA